MSFGSAAAPGFARVTLDDPCPCGGGRYGGCCAPLLGGDEAPTAERLMRSRYTAFVVGDRAHLERTWHPRTRPTALELDPGTHWLGLEIVAVDAGSADDDAGLVEFRARWRADGHQGLLDETSRFARRGGRWVYVDGDVR